MLIFASGRTDIPAFYSDWLMKRLRAGFVDVRNPYASEQVTRYKLTKDVVDCLVFCTKNPLHLLEKIDELKSFGIPLYFFVTITPYEKDVEPNVPDKDVVMDGFLKLSEKIGGDRLCWRYDPIFVDEKYSVSFHIKKFRQMCGKLKNSTSRCIISFIDLYQKTKKNFPGIKEVSESDQKFIAQTFSRIAFENGFEIESCAEELDLSAYGVRPGACVSKEIIEKSGNFHLVPNAGKQSLRKHCACLPTRDIGAYNSCPHLCKYCYANYDAGLVEKNFSLHNPDSNFLIGDTRPGDNVNQAAQVSLVDKLLYLF